MGPYERSAGGIRGDVRVASPPPRWLTGVLEESQFTAPLPCGGAQRRFALPSDMVASPSLATSFARVRILAPVLAAGLVVVATFARQQAIPKYRTIWAED